LIPRLSTLLSKVIEKSLPQLKQKARELLDGAVANMSELPPPPSDHPLSDLMNLVEPFCREIHAWIIEPKPHQDLVRLCRREYAKFQSNMSATHPQFMPFPKHSSAASSTWQITLKEEDDHIPQTSNSSLQMNLDDVSDHIENCIGWELPRQIPAMALSELIKKYQSNWNDICTTCFTIVQELTEKRLMAIVDRHFGRYPSLLGAIKQAMKSRVTDHRVMMKKRVDDLLSLESIPYTRNERFYLQKVDEYLEKFKRAEAPPTPHEAAPAIFYPHHGLIAQAECTPTTPRYWHSHEREITMMAECEAYFRVAYKRIIDAFPRETSEFFLKSLSQDLQHFLIGYICTDGSDPVAKAKLYLQEDPVIAKSRELLVRRRDLLEQALKAIAQFEKGMA